jgi:glycosyltransferase involved in cell wall biosynthesis
MKIVHLTTDAREHYKQYDRDTPFFGTAPEALLEGFAKLPEVEVHVVSCTRQPMRSPEKLADNIFFHSLVVSASGWKAFYLGCIVAVRKRLRQIQPQIVHGQGTERDCAISAVLSGFPNVLTIHGNMAQMAEFARGKARLYAHIAASLEKVALSRTLGVFCNSAFTESQVRHRTKRVWRVPNPVRSAFFNKPINSNKRGNVLLNVGAISLHKRQLELLQLAARLRQQGLNFHLKFIGSVSSKDPYTRKFLNAISVASQQGYASHLGFLKQDELIDAYDSASGMVHVASAESFGLVVAEALSRNMKFFGIRVGGIVDVAEGVEGAELFADNDWDGVGAAIRDWMKNGFGTPVSAAVTMRERYSPEKIARRHVEIYREVLSNCS